MTPQISTLLSAIEISSSSLISGTTNDSQGAVEIYFDREKYKKYRSLTILCGERSAFVETFFFVYFHKDDIVPDLADTFPGNDVFIITSEQAAESSGAWKYKGGELTAFAVKFQHQWDIRDCGRYRY